MTEYTLFDTAVGRCGIAWGAAGIVAVQLPEASEGATRTRLTGRLPGARASEPPLEVQRAVDGIVTLLDGEPCDLTSVVLDMQAVAPFPRRVYEATRAIAAGHTATYGEVAAQLGDPRAARAVGRALGANPFPLVVPCHRVVAAQGRAGGFSAHGGVATKQRLLAIEARHGSGVLTLFDWGAQ